MAGMQRFEVTIVGSGVAGAVLGRGLALAGRRVLVVERGRHPRFALGESSTPLAAIALERLASRWGGEDLAALAAAGRWERDRAVAGLRRGLKRGFTFYGQRPGEAYRNGPGNDRRLLVAASPDDEIADNHWLRSDVDHYLARTAVEAGAELWEECELSGVSIDGDGPVRLSGRRRGEPVEVETGFVVDASGGGGFLARTLGIGEAATGTPETSLLYAHFDGVRRFAAVAGEAGAAVGDGPYEEDRAAVHHVLDEGWMYVLRFDPERDGRALASVGMVLRREAAERLAGLAPEAAFETVLRRYPTLAGCFEGATAVRPVARVERLAYRRRRTHGRRWLLLPHAYSFLDPLFSTGMAWSLVGSSGRRRCSRRACRRRRRRSSATGGCSPRRPTTWPT